MMDNENEGSYKNRKKSPLFKKSEDILNVAIIITDMVFDNKIEIESEDDFDTILIHQYAADIRENAMLIPAKIMSAETVELYDIKMENATIIRKCAREIYVNCTGMRMCKFPDTDYLEVLRNEIDAFRIEFAEWVKTFDEWNYIIDRWGLFNPPGINYDDHDPDDDIPFNPDDFFEE